MESRPSEVALTDAQAECVDAILAAAAGAVDGFSVHLLYGVTGSGKTEVYLRVIAAAIARGGQALVLGAGDRPDAAAGGSLPAAASARAWWRCTPASREWSGATPGARRTAVRRESSSAPAPPCSPPCRNLALIVVDEEHDGSYKQHEGFRYSARDLAVLRARSAGVPIILGLRDAVARNLGKRRSRALRQSMCCRSARARRRRLACRLMDLRKHAAEQGLSTPAMQAIEQHLSAGGQVIVYLNRRGYAPSLFCNACGWVAPCAHCDARMTLHRRAQQLRCHHCGAHSAVPVGVRKLPPGAAPRGPGHRAGRGDAGCACSRRRPLARLDRDTAGARGAMQTVLDRVHSGEARILVGTQMLTKGHHFPEVSLVVILNADQGLFAGDFRATERLAQTITQVAGRAGRGTARRSA